MADYYSDLAGTGYFKGLIASESTVEPDKTDFMENFHSLLSPEERIDQLEKLITMYVARIAKSSPSQINTTMTFRRIGVDSIMAIQLRNLLEKTLNLKISVTTFWSHPSIKEYALFLNNTLPGQPQKDAERQASGLSDLKWFVIPRPNPHAAVRLFCFHDAGGSSSLYHSWENKLDDTMELVLVELPGRGKRFSEKMYADVRDLILDLKPVLTPLLDRPFAFFGHSMGSLIAFEMAQTLRKVGLGPIALFISSSPALDVDFKQEVDPHRNEEELSDMFPHIANASAGDKEWHRLLVDLLRSDLQLLNNYRYEKDDPLTIPLVVIHGEEDTGIKKYQAEAWCKETLGTCKVIQRPGGHRYIEHDDEFLIKLVQMEITAARNIEEGYKQSTIKLYADTVG
jgi:surfactin synthase thioesterase subunit/acyl carrier protein